MRRRRPHPDAHTGSAYARPRSRRQPPDRAEPPTPTLTPTPDVAPAPTPTPTPKADDGHSDHDHGDLAPTATPTPTPPPDPDAPFERGTGDVDGVAFVVGGESKATFSVGEVLANVSIADYEAVLETTGLSGEVRLDGGESRVTIDLHSMVSDNQYRDRYVQNRMFPDQRTASVAFGDLTPLPAGFTDGDPVQTEATGVLSINGLEVPMVYAIEARDDGDVVYVLGRSSFTWEQIGEPVPSAQVIVSLEDEVRVEVLLALTPSPAS